jgi:hypothetical protein
MPDPNDPKYIRILYDTTLKRPGCVILQAAAGCSSDGLKRYFHAEDWLLAPTPDMRIMHGTKEDWAKVATTPKSFHQR